MTIIKMTYPVLHYHVLCSKYVHKQHTYQIQEKQIPYKIHNSGFLFIAKKIKCH